MDEGQNQFSGSGNSSQKALLVWARLLENGSKPKWVLDPDLWSASSRLHVTNLEGQYLK